ncbi:MAG: glycoside hydrolase domain-containing protein, partial [Phycisphaerae bacterium]
NGTLRRMTPQRELGFYQMAHRHRFQPGVAYYRPALKIDGRKVSIDWTDYDRRVGRYLDGTAFTKACGYWGPGVGVPLGHILLPFNCNKAGRATGGWPLSMPQEGPTPQFEGVWLETARQVRAHFDADPNMRKVRKVVFLGGLDESYNEAAYKKMIYYSKLLGRGLGEGWFQYRIDGGYNRQAMEKLHEHVDLWVCHTIGFDLEKMEHFRGKGVESWFYGPMIYERRGNSACGSNTFTDLDLLTCRGVGWAAWKHASGFCEWEFDAFHDDTQKMQRPQKPWSAGWTKAMNCRYGGSEYNGSGLLIYRGELSGSPDPIASIRLKAHRRGFQDYEYFRLLREAGLGERADQLAGSIFLSVPFGPKCVGNTKIWKNDPKQWDAVRIEAGKLLHARPAR